MPSLNYTETLAVVHCTCGMPFGIPESLNQQALEKSGVSICCPLGHKWHYTETLEVKLRREREKSARIQANLDQAEASLIAQRGATTRFRNQVKRVEAGVCPHCRRNFTNLRRHMESKHSHD
jgi:hypothetical protein